MLNVSYSQKMELKIGNNIYKVRPIGQGSYGKVYKAQNASTRQKVAIKIISPIYEGSWRNEVKALQEMKHPNIIKYKSHHLQQVGSQRTVYILMEYFQGKTLREKIQQYRDVGLPEEPLFQIFSQLIDGFRYMHLEGLIHRDIKPQNILVDNHNRIKIIDLGLAKICSLMQTNCEGTPLYTPPQVYHGMNCNSQKRDVWSLGMVLYELLHGKIYYYNVQDKKQLKKQMLLEPIDTRCSQKYYKKWEKLTQRMLTPYPADRIDLTQIPVFLIDYQFEISIANKQGGIKKFFRQRIHPMAESSTAYEKIVRYLRFFYRKYSVIRHFFSSISEGKKFPLVPNEIKYVLCFLAIKVYICSVELLIDNLNHQRVVIEEEGVFDIRQLSRPQYQQLSKRFKEYLLYYEYNVTKVKNILRNNLLDRVKGVKQSAFLPTRILQKIHEFINNPTNTTRKQYLIQFKKVRQLQILTRLDNSSINPYLYPNDIVVYYLINMISRLDIQFSSYRTCNFEEADAFFQKIQFIKNQVFSDRQQTQKSYRVGKELMGILSLSFDRV